MIYKVKTMLKIKSDIDLKRLENFKFTTSYYSEYYKFSIDDEYLWVDKYNRKIDITSPLYFCKFTKCKNIINKLKKADMIEVIR